jgi:hypothetical protein
MDAATLAGIVAATAAQIASVPAAMASASGSQKETSYSWFEMSRGAPIANGQVQHPHKSTSWSNTLPEQKRLQIIASTPAMHHLANNL